MTTRAIGLVLAGGASRRMGRDKRWLVEGGTRPWVERAVALMQARCSNGFVSVAPGSTLAAIGGWPVLPDTPPAGRGPLAGIHAGLVAADGLDLCVLACDYPLMTPALLARICDPPLAGSLRLARDAEGRDHPLVGRWSAALRDEIERALDDGQLRVGALVARLEVERVDGSRELTNVNEPAELAALRENG